MVSVRPEEGLLFGTEAHASPASNDAAVVANSTISIVRTATGNGQAALDQRTIQGHEPNTASPTIVPEAPEHGPGSDNRLGTLEEQKAAFILLQSAGFDLGAWDFHAAEALRWAVTARHPNAITLLLDAGVGVNLATNDGLTALHWAVKGGNISIAEQLLKSGANTNAKDVAFGRTPLHLASILGRLDVAELLIRYGANMSTRNTKGHTALYEAIAYDRDTLVDALVTHGADIEEKDEVGRTAILLATSKSVVLIALALVGKGANVNARDSAGTTCLHLAARYSVSAYAEKLLGAGADIDAKNNEGQTPLIYAAMYGSDIGVRFLIENGANMDLETSTGETALSLARKGHHTEVVRLIVAGHLTSFDLRSEIPGGDEQPSNAIICPTEVDEPSTPIPAQESVLWDASQDDPNNRIDADDWLGHLKNAASEAEIPSEMIGVDAGFGMRASIVQFAPGENTPRATLKPTVHELLYGPGPRALMARRDTSDNPEFGSKFRWIHLPGE